MPTRSVRRNRAVAALAIALAAAPLAGCTGSRVVADSPTGAYTRGEVRYAASDRDLRVVIHGTPAGVDRGALERAVTAAMAGHVMGINTRFTTTPGDSARPDYKVVLAFDPAPAAQRSALCREGEVPTQASTTGEMTVEAAFCRGGALTSATGWLATPVAVDSAAFESLIGDLTFALFPQEERDGNDRDGCFLGGC